MNWELISSIMMTTLPADHPHGHRHFPSPTSPGNADLAAEALSRDHQDSPSAPQGERRRGYAVSDVWTPGVGGRGGATYKVWGWGPLCPAAQEALGTRTVPESLGQQ